MHPVVSKVIKNLFQRKPDILQAIKENMKKKGFSKAHPIILGRGPWTENPVIIDGYTRYEVAEELEIECEYDVIYFDTEDKAIEHAIYLQRARRNMTDAELVSCIQVLDTRKTPGRPANKLASCDANLVSSVSIPSQAESVTLPESEESQRDPDSTEDTGSKSSPVNQNKGKSAKETADLLGISTSKVERTRVVLAEDAPDEIKKDVLSGKKSINRASKEVKELRKAKTKFSKRATKECSDVSSSEPSDDAISTTPEPEPDKILQFKSPSNGFDERVEKILARIEALPTPEQEQILGNIEELLTDIEDKWLSRESGLEC